MYRKGIKVLDCTIRDGGLMNRWQFSDDFVRAVYKGCVEAGIDYMEIGYLSSESAFSPSEVGPWRFCREEDLRRIVGNNDTPLKLSAMADIGRIEEKDIPPAKDSVLDMIRVACYVQQMNSAIALAEHCIDLGYEVTINLMAVSRVNEMDLDEALSKLAASRVHIFYTVDSFGSMHQMNISHLVQKYRRALPERIIGIHAHNNMQMAMANTLTALVEGANMLDATMLGLGRGAGNCPMELLLAFLRNPRYKLMPLLEVIQEYLVPLQEEIQWGYQVPYLITGAFNEHPRSAMKWLESEQKQNLVAFLKEMQD